MKLYADSRYALALLAMCASAIFVISCYAMVEMSSLKMLLSTWFTVMLLGAFAVGYILSVIGVYQSVKLIEIHRTMSTRTAIVFFGSVGILAFLNYALIFGL